MGRDDNRPYFETSYCSFQRHSYRHSNCRVSYLSTGEKTKFVEFFNVLLLLNDFLYCFQGKCFAFIERSSHLYRALAAVPPWIHYLLNSQSSESSSIFFYDTLVGVCLCGIYLTCKAYRAIKLVRKWKLSVSKLLQSTVRSNHRHFHSLLECNIFFFFFLIIQRYGAHPSNEQLQNAGSMCPICHDGYRKPIFLSCKHIFCEDCLSMWLDRERTCPMCRSTVAEDPKWKDGSTSYLVQLF